MAVVAHDVGDATEIRTFLIADVRGYTRYTQEHGDEAGARLAARFAEVVREQIEARSGSVVELRGDEALCVFASPRAALRAAVDLQRRCADEIRAEPSLPLRLGIGVDAGEAVSVEGGYRGGPLNLAARLCSMAAAGEVLVSEGIVHLARHVDEMTYVDRGRVELKGLDEPVHVMQVQFELDMPAAVEASGPRWTPHRLAAVAGGAFIIAAVAILAATWIGGGSNPVLGTNVVGVLNGSGHVVGQVSLHGRPSGVAVGAGSVWVTLSSGIVAQIDPDKRVVVDRISTGVDPTGVAVGGGGVWVADSGSGTVSWVNASNPAQSTSIPVGQGPGAIAYGEGAAWVVNTLDGTLQRITPHLKVSGPIPIGGSPTAVAVGGGWVWVTDTNSSSVLQVNPETLQQVDRISVGDDPVAVAFAAGKVWVVNGADGSVTSLDPASGRRTVFAVGHDPSGLAYADGAVWVGVGQPASIVRIEVGSLHVSTTAVGSVPQAVAADGAQTWVTALASPASHRGGTLRLVGSDSSLYTTEPGEGQAVYFLDPRRVLSMTNDGLVTYRRVGGPAGSQIVPDLAISMPRISDGGRTYTFQLRDGVRYSNDRPVKASDFRYTVERQLRAGLRAGQLMFSNLVGADTCKPAACSLTKGIVTDDQRHTITLHLVRPDRTFLTATLASPAGDLLPPGSPAPDSGPLPATGPYMIKRFDHKHILLVRNPYFHQWSADAQPAGYPDQLQWTFIDSPDTELTDVEHGAADVMIDAVPPTRLPELSAQYANLAHSFPRLQTNYVFLNVRVPPFDHLSVRQALNLAIDRNHVVDLLGGKQVATPTCQVLPPGMPGYAPYCPYTANPTPTGVWSAPDLTRAQRLVTASGTQGATVTVWAQLGDPSNAKVAHYVASVLDAIGYHGRVHITPDLPSYSAAVVDSRNHAQAGIEGWAADYPSPINFLDQQLTCPAFVPSSQLNRDTSEFCDPRFDRVVHRAEDLQDTDPVRWIERWHEADRIAVDQAPWVPLTNPLGPDVISSRVGNYQYNPQWGALLDQLWVK